MNIGNQGFEDKQFYVYIMTNQHNAVLYVGVTSNLLARVHQHRERLIPGFTSRYYLNKLVYYEEWAEALSAIAREKQLKGGSRQKKIDLIEGRNPDWKDLYTDIQG